MTTKRKKPSMGVLNLSKGENKFLLSRHAPAEDIGFFVKHYWTVHWDLRGEEPYQQEIVPNPCINLVFEENKTGIFGIHKGKSSHLLMGKGHVFGVKFRPGGFYPFFQSPVSSLTNGTTDFQDVFHVDPQALEELILSQKENEKMVEFVENFIRSRLPEPDEHVELLNQIIDCINTDPEITKVDEICQRFFINKRTLQRLFDQYVGVSPKWVIKLYRLQQAAEKMDQNQISNWSKLAIDLGYYDQAHFIKDFKNFIGKSPQAYIQEIHHE